MDDPTMMLPHAYTMSLVCSCVTLASHFCFFVPATSTGQPQTAGNIRLRAGAAAIDITPKSLPVLVNGGFLQSSAKVINDHLFARCLVLDDGETRLAIVVVDSCMMHRELLDRAKEMARVKTGIPTERMLISATHTHSAPAAMGALGCAADPSYVAFLPERIAEGIAQATENLTSAQVGWGKIDDDRHTFCRRWIRRPDRVAEDPFGSRNVRANMHPGYVNPDAIGPSGPVDPALTVLSVQTTDGLPIAVLANYSQHYYGAPAVSSDYYGLFAAALARRIGAKAGNPTLVVIMSQGTSGDQMWMDYGRPRTDPGIKRYADEVAESAYQAYKAITTYNERVPLAMAETKLSLHRREPDEARLRWARSIISKMGDRGPRDLTEVYAKEAVYLHQQPERELRLQAIRIGDLGISAIPNEVFALTGLKLKARSPFPITMNIGLANGSEGYIPPPEQHGLGGYTTWPARTAALEVQAEPRIVKAVVGLLEQVAGYCRREVKPRLTPYQEHVLASKPVAYWRFEEMEGSRARDATGHEQHARYENKIAFFLPGVDLPGLVIDRRKNRAVHLAGGRILSRVQVPAEWYSVELWFWNGLPTGARPVTGYLFARSMDQQEGDVLGLGGTSPASSKGRLFAARGPSGAIFPGHSEIGCGTWHHVVLSRAGRRIRAYLDGNETPEIEGDLGPGTGSGLSTFTFGGRHDLEATLEGKIDEVALYDRPLQPAEIAEHYKAAQRQTYQADH
jgi:hypothetical protein